MASARKFRISSTSAPSTTQPTRPKPLQEHWALRDLKSIETARASRRAETLLGRIRRLAGNFSQIKTEMQKHSFDDETHLRASLFSLNPSTKVLRVDKSMLICRAPRMEGLPRLFAPYGLKGGAARLALLSLLGRNIGALRPRDVDVVRFGNAESEELTALDLRIAAEHMPEDLRHGFGIERCSSIDSYLATRDFTINEVALMGGQLLCSRQAISDTFHGIIRPTGHLLSQGGTLQGKMFMKALRLCAEAVARGEPASLEALPPYCLASPFDVALHLERACESGHDAANYYIKLAFEYGALDSTLFGAGTIESVTSVLHELLGENYPRCSPKVPAAAAGLLRTGAKTGRPSGS